MCDVLLNELYRQVPRAGIREHSGTIQVQVVATEVGDCSLGIGRYEHNRTEYYGGRKEPHQPSANEAITSVSPIH